jgi:hypothetical protein
MKPRPTIGILADEIRHKKDLIGKLTTKVFTAYLEACNEIGASVYTFSLNNIDLINKRVYGYIPTIDSLGNMVWNEQWLPIPDLIVNRALVSAPSIKNEQINKLIKSFPNVKIINKITRISKWNLHESLQNNNKINKYLPKTVLFDGIDSLNNMLKEFSCVYLKPTDSSLGFGIVRITKNKENEYQAKYKIRKNNYSTSGSLSNILLQLEPLMGKRIYIVQEGIPLATYRGNIFDIRVCIQKDGTGEWSIPLWIIRAAKPGNIVTNNAAGGSELEVEKVLNTIFSNNANEVLDKIKSASLLISEAIEKKFPDIGDIGMDLGITNTGKIYFIEANLRHTKFINGSSKEYIKWKITYKVPIYYLNYLYELEIISPKS